MSIKILDLAYESREESFIDTNYTISIKIEKYNSSFFASIDAKNSFAPHMIANLRYNQVVKCIIKSVESVVENSYSLYITVLTSLTSQNTQEITIEKIKLKHAMDIKTMLMHC
jgi:hypothetical protein